MGEGRRVPDERLKFDCRNYIIFKYDIFKDFTLDDGNLTQR
jgi:hypothetical protein